MVLLTNTTSRHVFVADVAVLRAEEGGTLLVLLLHAGTRVVPLADVRALLLLALVVSLPVLCA